MHYIGEFQKDSTILLELLTKDEKSLPIPTDFPPTAVIEHYDRNGIVQVDNVTLETMVDPSRYSKTYQIPVNWEYGDYMITYKVMIGGVEYATQEKFCLSRNKESIQESNPLGYNILEFNPLDVEEPIEEPVTITDGYIMPPDFQSPSTIQVVGNQIKITLPQNALYNHTYRVVLDKEIGSVNGTRLGSTKTVTFTSEYKPLFATPLEVQSVLRSIYKYFTPHDIYGAIRDAGQKALQLKGSVADANNSRYRDMRDSDTTLFPTQKYVLYEASRTLMTNLMIRILNGADAEEIEAGAGMIAEGGGSVTLGDFTVSEKSASSTGFGGTYVDKEESPLKKLQVLIAETEKEIKFWMDSMMGHNRRGYGKPLSGSFRTAAGSPEGRDF